jgi:hypothetical protein
VKFWALAESLILAAMSIGAAGARLPQSASPAPAPEPRVKLAPAEIDLYKTSQTLIDWTPHQVQHNPYLHGLKSAANQDQLPTLLDRTGQAVAQTFHNFRNVTCDERIVSAAYRVAAVRAKWDNPVNVINVSRRFHYIIVRSSIGNLPAFSEYRTELNGKRVSFAPDDPSIRGFPMLTWEFASTFLFFSPEDQHADRYRYLGVQKIRNRECYVVGFVQDPQNVCRANRFYVDNSDNVVLLQGMAWIDAQTFQILRVMTFLVAPRTDIGLDSHMTTVNFYPVRPVGMDTVLWLPRDVRVEILYRGTKIRNEHEYSNFKFFRVASTIIHVQSTIKP